MKTMFTMFCLLLAGCANRPAALSNLPPGRAAESPFEQIQRTLQTGVQENGVLTITYPRSDVEVNSTDIGEIPAFVAASRLQFFLCTCGKTKVVGELACLNYEVNDALDALRQGGLYIVSVSPLFLDDRTHLMAVRFQGESASAADISVAVKNALSWMGTEREKRNRPSPSP